MRGLIHRSTTTMMGKSCRVWFTHVADGLFVCLFFPRIKGIREKITDCHNNTANSCVSVCVRLSVSGSREASQRRGKMRPYVLILLSLLLLCYMIHAIPRLDYSERYPPPRDLEKRKACLNNCAENAVNALVVVVCQRFVSFYSSHFHAFCR